MSKYINCFDNKEDFSSKFVKHKTDIVYIKENKLKLYDNNIYDYLIYIPLSFEILEDGTVGSTFNKTIHYRLNDSNNWKLFTSNVSVKKGDIISFKGDNGRYGDYYRNNSYIFNTTCKFNICGNIMSLINSTNFSNLKDIDFSDCFAYLFYNCNKLISAKNLILPVTYLIEYCYNSMFQNCSNLIITPKLPAINLSENCYSNMFSGCISLTTAPQLPATTLELRCYQCMFEGCTSLTTAPELPATTLAESCYNSMFANCISLTIPPTSELPATTLAKYCYSNMFSGCTSLTTAPELPATTLAEYCYMSMFHNCTSLTSAPALPATTLENGCYGQMFCGCKSLINAPELPATTLVPFCYSLMFGDCISLNYIKCLATDISSPYCLNNWVENVSSSGTFIKDPNATWSTGSSGIPSSWTVQDAA